MKRSCAALLLLCFSLVWVLSGCKIETLEQHTRAQQQDGVVSFLSSSVLEPPSLSSVPSDPASGEGTSAASTAQSPSYPVPDTSSSTPATPSGQTSRPTGSTPASSSSPASAPPQNASPEPDEPQLIQVTLSIRCDNAVGKSDSAPNSGVMLSFCTISVPEGSTVFTATKAACSAQGVPLIYNGSERMQTIYIMGIGGLFEKDCGSNSGWKYRVNGSVSGLGCSGITLSAGDTIEWYYVTEINQ